MAQFDPSRIKTFTIPGDVTNVYAMIDATILANVEAGLTAAQKTLVDSYKWTPSTAAEIAATPVWGGSAPAPIYFRATQTQLQAALAKYYK